MLYKQIDPASLRLEYACPFCLSAKFAEAATLFDHVRTCPGATPILTAADLADIPNLQIGEGLTMCDYVEDEEAYYKNMSWFSQTGLLAGLCEASADDLLNVIIRHLKERGSDGTCRNGKSAVKNIEVAAWRIMATFFTLDDTVMERYLQIIYGSDEDSSEEPIWPAAAPASSSN
jgi:hypothetical protein